MATAAICLMGPTASGKTALAVALARRFPVAVISVDSAMVYRGLDIGTGKPDRALQAEVPHALIDVRKPEETYSAGEFVRDARAAMAAASAAGRVPLLVGGTHLYFRSLVAGIAPLPNADPAVRAALDADAERRGWPALHADLARADPAAAARIGPNDRQRIQRALEVLALTGQPLSRHWAEAASGGTSGLVRFALLPTDRAELHRQIEARLDAMLAAGFVAEVADLARRPGLQAGPRGGLPALRAVGYRQLWEHVTAAVPLDVARGQALAATRQLARRQLTWLRSEVGVTNLVAGSVAAADAIAAALADAISGPSR
jgi:tRNA dimethylallyltransferase